MLRLARAGAKPPAANLPARCRLPQAPPANRRLAYSSRSSRDRPRPM